MLREDTHKKIEQEAKSDSSMHENYIHVLVAKMIVNEIFNDHEAQMKAKDEEIERLKAIVEEAMKPKTCEGCKYGIFESNIKYVTVQDETLECCFLCIRNNNDYYEKKDNA